MLRRMSDRRGVNWQEGEENCITRSFVMGRAYSMNLREEEGVWVIGGKARGKETIRKTKM
jgi:hypothetical protein